MLFRTSSFSFVCLLSAGLLSGIVCIRSLLLVAVRLLLVGLLIVRLLLLVIGLLRLGGRLLVTVDNGERLYVSRQYAAGIKEKLREVERGILS